MIEDIAWTCVGVMLFTIICVCIGIATEIIKDIFKGGVE
jgi:hypothetical protein